MVKAQSAFTCSKLTIETLEQGARSRSGDFIVHFEHITHQWRRSGVFIVNSEHISHLVLVFLLLTLSR